MSLVTDALFGNARMNAATLNARFTRARGPLGASARPRSCRPWPPRDLPPSFPLTPYKDGWCKTIRGKWRHVCGKVPPLEARAILTHKMHAGLFAEGPNDKRERPPKPYASFPLFPHARGYWTKTIDGRHRSFGRWEPACNARAYEQSWRQALANLERFEAAQARGEVVAANPGQMHLRELVDRYLTARSVRERRGDLAARTFVESRGVLEAYCEGVGANQTIDDIERDPRRLRAYLDDLRDGGRLGWAAFNRSMRYIVSLWRWAAKPTSQALDRPFRWLELHAARRVRERRRQQREARSLGRSRDFTIEEIRTLIAHASAPLRAMILLAYFAGYGNQDVANLPRTGLEVFTSEQRLRFGGRLEVVPVGWARLNHPRPKTEIDRMAIVPPIVVDALLEADRQMPALDRTRHLLLRSELGTPLQTARVRRDEHGRPSAFVMTDNIGKQFGRLQRRLGTCPTHGMVSRPPDTGGRGHKRTAASCPECGEPITPMRRRGFYAIRHASTTAAVASGASSDTRDLFEGHTSGSMRQAFYVNPAQLHDLLLIARELEAQLGDPNASRTEGASC